MDECTYCVGVLAGLVTNEEPVNVLIAGLVTGWKLLRIVLALLFVGGTGDVLLGVEDLFFV